jgi:trans-aconitate 2-methyltransferase
MDWNPDLYLKFGRERIQPSIDLLSRVKSENPSRIIDIGCGPGNSTRVLAGRWPVSFIIGIDSSPAMIGKARNDYPDGNWEILDAGKDDLPGKFDLVFSNSTIQWIPDHAVLLRKFTASLNKNGVIAIQLPLFWDMPVGQSIQKIAGESPWNREVANVTGMFTINDHSFYYNVLSSLCSGVDVWETSYMHIMDSHISILEMIRSTGLKPYLEKMDNDNERRNFESRVLRDLERDYKKQADGKILFPFKRLFMVAMKMNG